MSKVHMVQQIIKYSDGTETVINYRGVIENGVLMPDEPEVEAAPAAPEEPASEPQKEEATEVEAEAPKEEDSEKAPE